MAEALFELSREEKRTLLELSRRTLEQWINHRACPEPQGLSGNLLAPAGAFVTLDKRGALRGCIGTIMASQPVYQAVIDNTIAASTSDPRFPAVQPDELGELLVSISVLSPMEVVSSVEEIEIGVHGLYLTCGACRGLLLPQVATEYGWSRSEFLEHTARKAGLPPSAWKQAQLQRFSAQVFGEEDTF